MVYVAVVMFVKEYYQNINSHTPRNYFERWYADVWRRRIGKPIAQPGILQAILTEEIASIDATVVEKDNDYKFVVTFNNDCDYTMFVLKWSS